MNKVIRINTSRNNYIHLLKQISNIKQKYIMEEELCCSCIKFKKNTIECEMCQSQVCSKCLEGTICIKCLYKECEICKTLLPPNEMTRIHNNRIHHYEEYYFCEECYNNNILAIQKKYVGFYI
jgi:hypothetical protein